MGACVLNVSYNATTERLRGEAFLAMDAFYRLLQPRPRQFGGREATPSCRVGALATEVATGEAACGPGPVWSRAHPGRFPW
jgi:hypothetical protein